MVRATGATDGLQLWLAGPDGTNARPIGDPVRGRAASIDW
jgi:hypothetical protein